MNDFLDNLNDPIKRKAVSDAVKLMSESYAKIETEKSHVKDTIDAIHEEYEIPKPILRRVAAMYHKQNFGVFQGEASVIKDLYTKVTTV